MKFFTNIKRILYKLSKFIIDTLTIARKINMINYKLDNLNKRLQWFHDFNCMFTDIAKPLPPARGYMHLAHATTTKLLELFNKICEENGLQYWLGAGNLLGIVRHNGQPVPWDDDIDVYMLRPDYEKVLSLLPEIFKDSDFCLVFRGFSLKFVRYKNFQLSFDIFPVEQYFKKMETEKEIKELLGNIAKLSKSIPTREQWIEFFYGGNMQEWFNKVWYDEQSIQTPPILFEKYNMAKQWWNSKIMENKEPAVDGLLCKGFERISWIDRPRYFWNYDWVFPLKKAVYNGVQTYIPNNPELYLNSQYGDYNAFPSDFHLHTANLKLPSSAVLSAQELISLDVEEFARKTSGVF